MTSTQPQRRVEEQSVSIDQVKRFWEAHPVAAAGIAAEPGTPAFYEQFDKLRALYEPLDFAEAFHAFSQFAGRRVLDVGCGNGYVLSKYAQHSARTFGVDLTRTAINLTRRRFELAGLPEPRLIEASAERLPFPSNTFDAVSSVGVVHQTPDDAGAIRELIRVLRPGGRLMVMVYYRNSALYRLTFPLARRFSRQFRGWDMQQLVNIIDGLENPLGRVYSREEFAKLLPGCEIVSMPLGCFRGTLPYLGPLGDPTAVLPDRVERALARRFGMLLYALAIKRSDGEG